MAEADEEAEKTARRAMKRQKAMEELIQTETTYVDQLQKLIEFYAVCVISSLFPPHVTLKNKRTN